MLRLLYLAVGWTNMSQDIFMSGKNLGRPRGHSKGQRPTLLARGRRHHPAGSLIENEDRLRRVAELHAIHILVGTRKEPCPYCCIPETLQHQNFWATVPWSLGPACEQPSHSESTERLQQKIIICKSCMYQHYNKYAKRAHLGQCRKRRTAAFFAW